MAPSALSTSPPPRYSPGSKQAELVSEKPAAIAAAPPKRKVIPKDFNPFHNPFSCEDTDADEDYPYVGYKPAFPTDISGPAYEPITDFVDRGTFADKRQSDLLNACSKVDDLTVNLGTELVGPQLAHLTEKQKDQLALLVAERGVVVFRDQEMDAHQLIDFGSYFGAKQRPLHQHPSSGVPRQRGLDDIHVVYSDETQRPTDTAYTKVSHRAHPYLCFHHHADLVSSSRLLFHQTELYHSDVTFELNPPGLTALMNYTHPVHGGGDTLFTSCYGLYDSLSPPMREYLESLSAIQSGLDQGEGARKAGLHLRREPIETIHPVVRTHPVTGWKSIFVNPAFTKAIVCIPKIESDTILAMLYSQMAINSDLTLRVKWAKGTCVVWDNRIVNHSATYDHWRPSPDCRRHALRVAATAEIPSLLMPDGSEGTSRKESIWEEQGLDVEALNQRERAMIGRKGGFKD